MKKLFLVLWMTLFTTQALLCGTGNALLTDEFWESDPDVSAIQKRLDGKTANIIRIKTEEDLTLLHYAARFSTKPEVIEFVIKAGIDINNHDNVFNISPLHVALSYSNATIIPILLAKGANPNIQDVDGDTPLYYALAKGFDSKIIQNIIDKGADVNVRNNEQETPLHVACISYNTDALQILLNNKSNVNAQDISGSTPLHWVLAIPELLSKTTARLYIKGYEDDTAIHMVIEMMLPGMVELLLKYGADLTIPNNEGITPLAIINQYDHTSPGAKQIRALVSPIQTNIFVHTLQALLSL